MTLDLVKCAHCNTPVSWSDYGEHVELWHGNWKGILPPTGLPDLQALAIIGEYVQELQGELDAAKDRIEELELELLEGK